MRPVTIRLAGLIGSTIVRIVSTTTASTITATATPSCDVVKVATRATPTAVPTTRVGSDHHSPGQSIASRSLASVTIGITNASHSSSAGIRLGSSRVVTGAATSPMPSPTSPCAVAPANTARAITAQVHGSNPTGQDLCGTSGVAQVAQHVRHDPAVTEVVRLARGVDPYDRVELDRLSRARRRTGLDLHRVRCRPGVELGDPGDLERLLAGEPERLGVLAVGVLQRQHAHPDQVGPVD